MKRFFITIALLLLCGGNSLAQFPPVIDAQKDAFYSRLNDSTNGYIHIPHSDFIPLSGPKPNGESDLSADVWVAWDEKYFYLYAEVKDDIVQVTSKIRPWNDCIELKFDPDPTTRALTGILGARLSALDSNSASNSKGVDNLYPERDSLLSWKAASPANYARRSTKDGYALELRLAWEWIRWKDRAVRVGIGEIFGLAINIHDNDDEQKRSGLMKRDGTIQWSAGMADDVWLVPQLLGTIEFQADHKLKLIRRNAIDTSDGRAKTFLSAERFATRAPYRITIENWRYRSGDNPEWAKPYFDDRSWEATFARLTERQKPESGWTGIGWFRAHVAVDSSIWNVPLGFLLAHWGACEVYLDGNLLYAFGKIEAAGTAEESFLERTPRSLVFGKGKDHLLAIRYSNTRAATFIDLGFDAGIQCVLSGDINEMTQKHADTVREITRLQVLASVVPVVLGILHVLLFIFLPRTRENLYFALFMFSWGTFLFLSQQMNFYTSAMHLVNSLRVAGALLGFSIMFGLLTIYMTLLARLPVVAYSFIAGSAVLSVYGAIRPIDEALGYCTYAFIGLTTLEIFRVFAVAGRDRWRQRWIAAVGIAFFMLTLVWQILIQLEVLPVISGGGAIGYGLLALSVCVSIDFSRNFARTSKDLEKQLIQVRDLSAKALEQERHAREEEIGRRLLETDNARKTKELEDARQVQLSLLPKDVPRIGNLEIAVSMETATEVGGDYYDFHLSNDGTLTVALGDATGHGAKAGTMVSITKGLFHELAGLESLPLIFERFTTALKHMSLGQLYMGLMLVRIKDHTLAASAAGMPPMFLYRAATQTVERVAMKGMPLGSFERFPYQTKELRLNCGDTILLMSDGYLEMFNEEGETLEESRAVAVFGEVADRSPKEIIDYLVRDGKKWANGKPQVDDVTFVVLKAR